MKSSDKLYNINAMLSVRTYILKKTLTLMEMGDLNSYLGDIIKEVREMEERKEEREIREKTIVKEANNEEL